MFSEFVRCVVKPSSVRLVFLGPAVFGFYVCRAQTGDAPSVVKNKKNEKRVKRSEAGLNPRHQEQQSVASVLSVENQCLVTVTTKRPMFIWAEGAAWAGRGRGHQVSRPPPPAGAFCRSSCGFSTGGGRGLEECRAADVKRGQGFFWGSDPQMKPGNTPTCNRANSVHAGQCFLCFMSKNENFAGDFKN